MKFCPRCGVPREKNFCAKCGFAFAGPLEVAAPGSEVGLAYGENFDLDSHCANCGTPRASGKASCDLCGFNV